MKFPRKASIHHWERSKLKKFYWNTQKCNSGHPEIQKLEAILRPTYLQYIESFGGHLVRFFYHKSKTYALWGCWFFSNEGIFTVDAKVNQGNIKLRQGSDTVIPLWVAPNSRPVSYRMRAILRLRSFLKNDKMSQRRGNKRQSLKRFKL